MSQQSGVINSTPAEEQQTDEQKTENAADQAAAAANSPRLSNRGSRSCTHYPNSCHPEQAVKEAALADVILARPSYHGATAAGKLPEHCRFVWNV